MDSGWAKPGFEIGGARQAKTEVGVSIASPNAADPIVVHHWPLVSSGLPSLQVKESGFQSEYVRVFFVQVTQGGGQIEQIVAVGAAGAV